MQITIKKEHRYNAIKTVRSICAVFFCLCALFVSIQVAIIFVAVASADEDDFIEIHFCLDSFLFSFILHILKYGTPVSVLFLCQFVQRFFSVLFRSYNFRCSPLFVMYASVCMFYVSISNQRSAGFCDVVKRLLCMHFLFDLFIYHIIVIDFYSPLIYWFPYEK